MRRTDTHNFISAVACFWRTCKSQTQLWCTTHWTLPTLAPTSRSEGCYQTTSRNSVCTLRLMGKEMSLMQRETGSRSRTKRAVTHGTGGETVMLKRNRKEMRTSILSSSCLVIRVRRRLCRSHSNNGNKATGSS